MQKTRARAVVPISQNGMSLRAGYVLVSVFDVAADAETGKRGARAEIPVREFFESADSFPRAPGGKLELVFEKPSVGDRFWGKMGRKVANGV